MFIGNRNFELGKTTYVMGILNVTPDSFSDGGKFSNIDAALKHAEEMVDDGVDIIDIGGESTRPGYTLLSDEEEMSRVLPVIEAVKRNFDVPVSIDTNQITLLDIYDEKLAEVIARTDVPCCLMHNRKESDYNDFLTDLVKDLEETIAIAENAGISKDKIILDPGVGFGKTYEMNLAAINHLDVLTAMGYPVLLGTSRKSVIGLTLDLPVTEREEGTLVTTIWAVQNHCDFVRVHNVKANKRAIQMAEAILKA